MAIYGIGAFFEADDDVSTAFLQQGCACVFWREDEAPPAHSILRHMRAGDIVYIKTFSPQTGLTIKAVGLVTVGGVREYADVGGHLGWGVPVIWAWTGNETVGRLDDKWPVRTVTLYEEQHPKVHTVVLELLRGQITTTLSAG